MAESDDRSRTERLHRLSTRVAVRFQNVDPGQHDEVVTSSLGVLREAAGVDAIALITFSEKSQRVEPVRCAVADGVALDLESLEDVAVDTLTGLSERLAHLRLVELADAADAPAGLAGAARVLQALGIGAALVMGFAVDGRLAGFVAIVSERAVRAWDPALATVLELVVSSYASGQQRLAAERQLASERQRNELAMISANDGVWDFDVQANTIFFSPRWKRMLGYEDGDPEMSVPDWGQLVHPDDLARVQSMMRRHLGGETEIFESIHRLRHRNGEWRWVLSRAKSLPDDDGRLQRLVGVELDITDRKLYEDALYRQRESAHITLASIGDGVISTDAECNVEYINPVAEELTGWRLEEAEGRPVDEIFRGFHEETCEPLENALAVAIRRQRSIKSLRPTLLIRRDGNELYIESTASPIRDRHGKIAGGVLVFHDVSESRELNRRLSYHASHDMLTGLVNRREFENQLQRALGEAKAREADYALCHIDLDQFKMINDSCGHTAGDLLLKQMGQLLKSKIRWRDTLARLGGDEFGLLLECDNADGAVRAAEGLLQAVEGFKFNWDDRNFRLSISVGVVQISPESGDAASLLSAAEGACAAAKGAGRNRVHVFQDNDIELMRRRRDIQWAARINNALEESRFELFRQVIQPLGSAADGGDHYELLLRLRDEGGKMISPGEFISAAERYGLAPGIDRWVIDHALHWLDHDAEERARLGICSINLSGQSLGDDKFLPYVIERLERSRVDPRKICFEITETAAIASYTQANHLIQVLRELGCRFALDDFGTGLSSFAYLKHFEVDYLKIDGSFVKGILHDPIDREMVRSINELGHLTGKTTIAEFAENDAIIDMLRSIGVDYAQGYGVAEPRLIRRPARPPVPSYARDLEAMDEAGVPRDRDPDRLR